MARTCVVCSSSERIEIDKQLAAGTPLRDIAGRWHVSKSALARHKTHLGAAIARAAERREESIGGAVLDRLEGLYGRGLAILDLAEAERDPRLALKAISELRGLLAGLHQIAVDAANAAPRAVASDPGDIELIRRKLRERLLPELFGGVPALPGGHSKIQ
jgi:hypothetical protein